MNIRLRQLPDVLHIGIHVVEANEGNLRMRMMHQIAGTLHETCHFLPREDDLRHREFHIPLQQLRLVAPSHHNACAAFHALGHSLHNFLGGGLDHFHVRQSGLRQAHGGIVHNGVGGNHQQFNHVASPALLVPSLYHRMRQQVNLCDSVS